MKAKMEGGGERPGFDVLSVFHTFNDLLEDDAKVDVNTWLAVVLMRLEKEANTSASASSSSTYVKALAKKKAAAEQESHDDGMSFFM